MRQKILIVTGILAAGVLFYTVKCQLGVDLIENFCWEEKFPVLDMFQKHAWTVHPRPGEVLVRASFDDVFPAMPWGGVYGPGKKWIKDRFVPQGRGGSKALRVDNRSDGFWVKEYYHWVAVKPGEVFGFRGFVRLPDHTRAFMAVSLYDAGRKVLDYDYAATGTQADKAGEWQELDARVTLPGRAAFIRLRLTGEGRGVTLFDDVLFWREQ